MIFALKSLVEKLPYSVGRYLASVPFDIRFGSSYSDVVRLLEESDGKVESSYVIEKFRGVFNYSKTKYSFYRNLYKEAGVYDLDIRDLEDIQKIPVIDKSTIREGVHEFNGALKLNTGGTTGSPFSFYVDKNAFAREWAHMHYIWAKANYKYRDIKLTFRGKKLGNRGVSYNPVHNEFVINTYINPVKFKDEFVSLVVRHNIKFMHGYPSAIYSFFKEIDELVSDQERELLKKSLSVCLFASEFPVGYMVEYLTKRWGLTYLTWYGLSEMCILAYDETQSNKYKPMHSYGYAEVIDNSLIGTSFHNFDMPLIRYNTGDIVDPVFDVSGMLSEFSVTQGRSGDFVLDENGKMITLTALIFGRHHKIFEFSDAVQVYQPSAGKVNLLVVSKVIKNPIEAISLFDISGVKISFCVEIHDKPVLTAAGKMPLKISQNLYKNCKERGVR